MDFQSALWAAEGDAPSARDLRFGSTHAPRSELLKGQDVAVDLGVHSDFLEIGLDPDQYHFSFTSFCMSVLRERISPRNEAPSLCQEAPGLCQEAPSLCNAAPARLVNAVCAFMSWDPRRAAVFRNGTATAEIAPGCAEARFARLRALNPRSR